MTAKIRRTNHFVQIRHHIRLSAGVSAVGEVTAKFELGVRVVGGLDILAELFPTLQSIKERQNRY